MARRRRARREAIQPDFGPEIRLVRGEVIAEGDPARPRGRAMGLVDTLGPELRGAAAMVLSWFERAQFNGYARSKFDGAPCGSPADARDLSDNAIAARRRLAQVEARLGRLQWSAVWHLLFFEESQSAWAMRARNAGYAVSRRQAPAVLMAALDAVAAMRAGRR